LSNDDAGVLEKGKRGEPNVQKKAKARDRKTDKASQRGLKRPGGSGVGNPNGGTGGGELVGEKNVGKRKMRGASRKKKLEIPEAQKLGCATVSSVGRKEIR